MYVPNIELLVEDLPNMNDEEIAGLFGEMCEALENVEDVGIDERASYFIAMTDLRAVVKAEMLRRGFEFLNC